MDIHFFYFYLFTERYDNNDHLQELDEAWLNHICVIVRHKKEANVVERARVVWIQLSWKLIPKNSVRYDDE